jgi:N utilization substance protein B
MGAVDRNVLRLAIYEMFFESETPPVVCINEAVDLAKFFSSFDSGRFVNGILDRACRDVTRPPRSGRVRPARSARSARKPAAAPPAAAAAAP